MKPLTLVLMLTAIAALAGCETVKGAGRDLQSAGHAVSTEAQHIQAQL